MDFAVIFIDFFICLIYWLLTNLQSIVNGIFCTFSVKVWRRYVLILDRFICLCYPTWSCDVLFYLKQMLRHQAPLIPVALTPESLSHVQKYFCVNIKTCSFWAVKRTVSEPKQTQLLDTSNSKGHSWSRRCYAVWKAESTKQPVHPITRVCWDTRQWL